jgi:transcriptional repressor BetI
VIVTLVLEISEPVFLGFMRDTKMGRREKRKQQYQNQMIDAALASITETGLARVNVRQISDKAGVSFGNFHYHYGGKDGLLLQALRKLLTEIKVLVRQKTSSSDDCRNKLQAYIDAQFDPAIFTTDNCTAWLNFWNEASTQAKFARLERINRSRNLSNLRFYLGRLIKKEAAVTAASDIHDFVNGLWMHKALIKDGLTAAHALDSVQRFLDCIVPVKQQLISKPKDQV